MLSSVYNVLGNRFLFFLSLTSSWLVVGETLKRSLLHLTLLLSFASSRSLALLILLPGLAKMLQSSAHIALSSLVLLTNLVSAQSTATTLAAPGQPTQTGTPLTFKVLGESGVSAQQLFLGSESTVSNMFNTLFSSRPIVPEVAYLTSRILL